MIKRRRQNSFKLWLVEPFLGRRGPGHNPDYTLLVILGLLLFFGLVFLSSASSTLAFYRYGDSYRFVKQQILHGLIPGLILFYFALRVNFNFYRKIGWGNLVLSVILLGLVFLSGVAGGFGTAQSWISLGPITFQPSELVKLLFILFLAFWFESKGRGIKNLKKTTIPFVIILGIISAMIIKQPDIGTLGIICFAALVMWFAAGAKWSHVLTMIGAGIVALVTMIKAAPYRMQRFTAWLNPDIDPQGIGWQIKQSLIAIGAGGWFGLGLGSSRQKTYLPWPANDSIFAVIAEEIGFIFTLAFIFLFCVLIYRCFHIIRHTEDNFAKLVVLGIVAWLAIQLFINIGGMIGLMPLTGVPLPFVSLGGTNLAVTLAAMGAVANISRFTTHGRR